MPKPTEAQRQVARGICPHHAHPKNPFPPCTCDAVASALADQREQDAEIAMLTHVPEATPIGEVPGFLLACEQIGKAIRQGTNQPTE